MRRRLVERAGGFGGVATGPNPTDRAKPGTKHHLVVDRTGVPVACRVGAANAHDVTMLLPTVVACRLPGDALPGALLGDRAYSSAGHEAVLAWLGVAPVFARPGAADGSGLGAERYVVERTLANVHQNRRLRVRYDRRADIHQAFPTLACIKLCHDRLAAD